MYRTSYIRLEQCCAVVPTIVIEASVIVSSGTYFTGLATIGLVIFIWAFSFLMRVQKRSIWHPFNIIFLFLGIAVAHQPSKVGERFIFGSLLFASLFYSSNIFAMLTSFNLAENSIKPFDSFEELDDSKLVPIVHPNMFNMTFESGNPVLHR